MKTLLACPIRIVKTRKPCKCHTCCAEIPIGSPCLAFSVNKWPNATYHHVHAECVSEIDWRAL